MKKTLQSVLILIYGAFVALLEIKAINFSLPYADVQTRKIAILYPVWSCAAFFTLTAVAPFLQARLSRWILCAASLLILFYGSTIIRHGEDFVFPVFVSILSLIVWCPLLKTRIPENAVSK